MQWHNETEKRYRCIERSARLLRRANRREPEFKRSVANGSTGLQRRNAAKAPSGTDDFRFRPCPIISFSSLLESFVALETSAAFAAFLRANCANEAFFNRLLTAVFRFSAPTA